MTKRTRSILQAVFVTVLWASSWILIKIGLRNDLPPVTFAGLRYFIAWLCLIPFVLTKTERRAEIKGISRREWIHLTVLGVVYYTITQGLLFLTLDRLPAAMVSLLVNLTPVLVGIFSTVLLKENPTFQQKIGIVITTLGVVLYFLPFTLPRGQIVGVLLGIVIVFTNGAASLLGRGINRQARVSPLVVTFVSMGIGSTLLLMAGVSFQGFGVITPLEWLIIAWMAVVNTAFAFTIWNTTLRTLTAVESSVVNSLMMPQIAVLAFVFLGETLNVKEIIGLLLVGGGVLIVQLRGQQNKDNNNDG